METLKKIGCLVALLLWVGAIICGLVLFIKAKSLVPILSFVLMVAMSVPTAKAMFKYLTS